MDLHALLAERHGVVTAAELRSIGITRHGAGLLLADGTLRRIAQGRFAAPGTLDQYGRARALNGAVSCVSALADHGLWVPERAGDHHVRVTRHVAERIANDPAASRLAAGAVLHVLPRRVPGTVPALGRGAGRALRHPPVDSLWHTILTAAHCCEVDELVAVLESAMRRGVAQEDILAAAGHGNARLRRAAGLLEQGAESGAESIARVRLRALRVPMRIQARIGRWPVDLLLGERLVVEIDGRSYHSAERDFLRDRVKDRELHELGCTVLRFTYGEIMRDWEACFAQIRRFVRAGRHRAPGRGPLPPIR